jgi:glycosyltransferase involved in cell wall biosynthesis
MTVRNEEHSIGRTIDSILAQDRMPDEWIVADGGSADGTVEILEQYPEIALLQLQGNIAQGRNAAIARSTGEIIVVTDAGTIHPAHWLRSLVEPLEKGEADFTASPSAAIIESPFDAIQWMLLDQFCSGEFSWRSPSISSRSLAFRHELWEECHYPEWLDQGEDRWMIDRWIDRGAKKHWVRDATVQWEMRKAIRGFLRQHYLYMRGDGLANMRTVSNLLRLFFYSILVVLVAIGCFLFPALYVAVTLWAFYLALSGASRFDVSVEGQGAWFKTRVLLGLPAALLGMDLAKMAGYLVGLSQSVSKESVKTG